MAKFYVTTAIDYPSSAPHLGHAYEKTVADVMARWNRLLGKDVFFLTGTDEHGMKIQRAAEKEGKSPKDFVDKEVVLFRKLCDSWNISYDNFIRTTDPKHEKICRKIFAKVLDKGDIYLGSYEGLYCTDCERFYLEKDLSSGNCPVHNRPPEKVKEPSYFFRMSRYQKRLLEYFEKNPNFIYPVSKRQEIINRVKEGLLDLSVSRASFRWGIPLPNDSSHVIYVWFDALLNYVSGIDYGSRQFDKFWPADAQNIGKDILWFHSVIWPCMLFAADIEPPRQICVHGFINTASGVKMAKSSGNIIDPIALAERYGADSLRYFLLREIPFGQDGNFSERELMKRHNNELANELGNLVFRVLSLIEKRCNGKVPDSSSDSVLMKKLRLDAIKKHMDSYAFHSVLAEIFSFIGECNRYINAKEPWKQEGRELEKTLYTVADAIRITTILLSPFIPESCARIQEQFGFTYRGMGDCKQNLLKAGTPLKKGAVLFSKMEAKEEETAQQEKEISVAVDPEVRKTGFRVKAAAVYGARIKKKHEGLEKLKREAVSSADIDALEKSSMVEGFKEIYHSLGFRKKQNHALNNLIGIVKESGKLPTINTVVDSYNLVSLRTGVVAGAHDLDKVKGNVRIKLAEGNELYIPLGSTAPKPPEKGEYIFTDDEVVLCRLDVKQGIHTMITNSTKNILVYVQGNEHISETELDAALSAILSNIKRFCGGRAKPLEVR
jgi:methionyl-tRNA synthetase